MRLQPCDIHTLRAHHRPSSGKRAEMSPIPNQLSVFAAVQQLFLYPEDDQVTFAYKEWPRLPGFPSPPAERSRYSLIEDIRVPYASPPLSPFDMFAIAAHLLDISGAYHHIVSERDGVQTSDDDPSVPARSRRTLVFTEPDIKECRRLGALWRKPLVNNGTPGANAFEARSKALIKVHKLWDELLGSYGLAPVYEPGPHSQDPPKWWRIALMLLVIADEAAEGAGFELENKTGLWFMVKHEAELRQQLGAWTKRQRTAAGPSGVGSALAEWGDNDRIGSFPVTLSAANPDVVCVQPKSRTSAVGCTMRSLSQNLALLPPRGVASAAWAPLRRSGERRDTKEDDQFNILLVPFPFSVDDKEFIPNPRHNAAKSPWGSFHLRQSWRYGYGGPFRRSHIVEKLVDFIAELASVARHEEGASRIDAIVLPELALDHRIFSGLVDALPVRMPELRFLISGLSTKRLHLDSDANLRHGNFVGVAAFQSLEWTSQSIREKHHRWCLDEAQIETYGLEGVLDPRRRWWEDIDLMSRRVDFTVFQQGSVLAAMICEDLARVDPCQELLRAMGPSLVIALLMDAPQLATRWPARYATILAEDPGSSVLTLTSRGLMTRQRLLAKWPASQYGEPVVALWRDNYYGRAMPIVCPYDCQGVWLKLHGRPAKDLSLDGRESRTGWSWIHGKDRALRIPDVDKAYGMLLGPADKELRARLAKEKAARDADRAT